jgi:hypothetical protein
MPEEDAGTGELQHPGEVLDGTFPPGDEASEVVEPGEEAFDLPSPLGPAERPAVLGARAAAPMGRDHLDAVLGQELRVERVAVVAAIADEARREVGEKPRVEGGGDEVAFIWRSAGHVHGDRKTMTVADRHDLGAFAAARWTDRSAPFFAPA